MGREDMRAGDSDRKVVAEQLKTALDEGRLDLSEYDERIQRTYAAKTYADLDGLLDDLPGTVPVQHSQIQPAASAPPPGAPAHPGHPAGRQIAHWVGPYAGVILVCTVIWAITSASAGHLTYFWPVWMLIPLIFGVFGQWFGDGGRRDRRRR
ncbi:DUF1707 SHOCT-like domain-containing protein [Actinoplanes sp. CA-030573]|uniref:DUF1707 SHOCT-like domain-containing protein n=1 Tax=Actinoplanes sp. CA-030573 TaxID=3239898 RepID=UPI003D92D5E2